MKERTFYSRKTLFFGIHLLAGAAGVLAGLQYLLSASNRIKRAAQPIAQARETDIVSAKTMGNRTDYFSIRRTKSELGYIYWVLHGHGDFQCFALLDTWKEAVEEAGRRLSQASLNAAVLATSPGARR
jgi:hypothetical protein